MIDSAKVMLNQSRQLPQNYWPTRAEIAAASGYSLDELFKPSSWGEVCIVNQMGSPALAYLSNAIGGLPEGCLVTSEDLKP